ncbi:MAG: 5'-nucleotidase C-terminal domain-containing protein [Spirochaetales bacterium]|nr:5'-nucleotidase C-terminal domain-containing protein [Spirochaetales bacterium]
MKKKYTGKLLILSLLLAFLSSCASFKAVPQGEIVIIHTNDTHGRIMETPQDGMGFPQISGIVSEYRRDYPGRVLLLDAGDTFHGTPFAALSQGENVAKVIDSMEYDAVAVGNHDMNYGLETLEGLNDLMEYTKVISANMVDKTGHRPFEPYVIKNLGPTGKIKVGIFGLTTPQTLYKSNPKYVDEIAFRDTIETAQAMVDELKDQVNIIICLSHLGVNPAYEVTSIDVAREVHGIDLIVDGHSHTILQEGLWIEGTPIVQAGYSAKYVGVVTMSFGPDGTETDIELISKGEASDYSESSSLLYTVNGMDEANKLLTGKSIGETQVRLDGERAHVRSGQTNLGTLIAESARWISGADTALINGGGIRASIEMGTITTGAVLNVLPFGNTVRVIEISGAGIVKALENGVAALPEPAGAFPHTAGISYDINLDEAGNTVSNVKINGAALEEEKIYTLATSDFLVLGGDEYAIFTDCPVVKELSTFDEVLEEYLKEYGPVTE